MTIIIGYFQQRHSLGMYTVEAVRSRKPLCSKYMILIGGLRYATAFLGLYALKYVEVSFTETVKSTAPAFTLLISSLILGMLYSWYTYNIYRFFLTTYLPSEKKS